MPARLDKREENGSQFIELIEAWVLAHANILMPLCMVILIALCVMLCYALVGASAVESGNLYNHMGDVI